MYFKSTVLTYLPYSAKVEQSVVRGGEGGSEKLAYGAEVRPAALASALAPSAHLARMLYLEAGSTLLIASGFIRPPTPFPHIY